MREHQTVITRKGQITIPVEIRRALQLKVGDRIALALEGDQVRLWPTENVVARTAGMLQASGPVVTAEEEREQAERAIAEEVVARN